MRELLTLRLYVVTFVVAAFTVLSPPNGAGAVVLLLELIMGWLVFIGVGAGLKSIVRRGRRFRGGETDGESA